MQGNVKCPAICMRGCIPYFLIILLTLGLVFLDNQVVAQQHSSVVIVHPGQDVELLCDVTPSGNRSVAWAIDNRGPYRLSAIRNGIVSGHTNDLGRNNLIIRSIMMDDDRNDTEYQCVIAIPGATPQTLQPIERGNITILYVAGVPAMVPNVTIDNTTIVFIDNFIKITLSWGEPFNNLDRIVNYTVSCSGDVKCPPTFNTTDKSVGIFNLTTNITYTFSVVATNSIGSGEAGEVMITTPPGKATTATPENTTATIITTATTDATKTTVVEPSSDTNPQMMTDDETDNSGVVIAVVIVVVLLILVGCIIMDILFCYCCKRKERHHQDNEGEDKMSHYCIIVLGISTLGTSVLLWWLYKYFSGKDKYNVEAHSAVPLSSTKSSTKDDHKDKDDYKRSVEYDTTAAEATSIQGSPPAVSYAATTQALSKDTNTGPTLQYDYARTGPLKIADDTAQQSIPAKPVEESYAVSDVVKDKKKDKKEKADTKNQRLPEYAAVDKSKKKKKNDKQQMDEQDIQQPQMAGHKQKTELNYMDPSNLEFTEEPHNSARKRETDQTVQYGNLMETPQYTNIM